MKLKENTVFNVNYTKSDNSSTNRYILPTSVPTNVKAIDVTDLSEEERNQAQNAAQEYAAYVLEQTKELLSFEEFLEEKRDENCDLDVLLQPKWRTFKPEGLEVLMEGTGPFLSKPETAQ